ncbi:3D protein, partial [human gut metagenome]
AVTMTGFSYNDKTVTVMVDGAAHTVRTHLNSNEGIVRDAGVKLNPNDKVISSSASVQNGTTLTVVRAIPVYVTVNGKTRAVFTTETTAQGVANELGFKMP